jgi:type I restriction enzyme S subunit
MSNEKLEIVPELRFPEFSGNWKERKLENVGNFKSGIGFTESEQGGKSGIPFFKVSDMNLESNQKVMIVANNYVNDEQISRLNYKPINKQSIIFAKVGAAVFLERKRIANNFLIDNNMMAFTPNENIGFIRQWFDTIKLSKYAKVGALPSYNASDLKTIKINLPPLLEQQKIADCLSSLDKLITTQTKKLDNLKTHKKGLMQQLFPAEGKTTPKCRFPEFTGEWEKTKLGEKEISDFIKDRVALNQLDIKTYISTENLLPNYSGIKIATKLPPSGSFIQFKKKDILISNIRPYLKKVWQATINGNSSNDVIVIRAKTKVIDSFLVCILKNDNFIDYVMKNAKGTKMPRGDLSSIKKYSLFYPKKREQKKIADCLTSLDELITTQTHKIDNLKTHKKGLMQQLFPVIN